MLCSDGEVTDADTVWLDGDTSLPVAESINNFSNREHMTACTAQIERSTVHTCCSTTTMNHIREHIAVTVRLPHTVQAGDKPTKHTSADGSAVKKTSLLSKVSLRY